MSRPIRKNLEASFFHVMAQGIKKEYIFNKEIYMKKYKDILKKHIEGTNLKIISFCIMHNHVHILFKVKEMQELSKYMQKVNSSYAKYYNHMEDGRVGYVFRDRFKSVPILNRAQLIQCIKYIHNNPVKANIVKNPSDYKYSSYNHFKGNKNNDEFFSKEEMEYLLDDNQDVTDFSFIDIEDEEILINEGISEFLKKENVKLFEIFEKSDILGVLVKFLKDSKKLKYTEIMKELDITKGTMERLKR